MEQVSQPFTQAASDAGDFSGRRADSLPELFHLLPAYCMATWLGGFVVVLSYVVRALAAGFRSHCGKQRPYGKGAKWKRCADWSALQDCEAPIEMVVSRASLEPGIFGIVRPVLIWPEGISEHLDDAHLEAILAHEVWHVRRRDNLAAAIHMVVEALFWFHPLVWWIGARLVEERERACDEEVVATGRRTASLCREHFEGV